MNDHKVVLFGSGRGWHAQKLIKAFRKRGVNPVIAPLDKCAFSSRSPTGIQIPALRDELPAAGFVRMMPKGTFEEVTFYLGILHALEHLGVPIWNSAKSIERCTDKSTTTFLLRNEGLKTPDTWAGVRKRAARNLIADQQKKGRLMVQKPLFGSQGKGLRLIRSPKDLSNDGDVNGVYYLQEFITTDDNTAQDWRVFVCGSEILGAMIRRSSNWIKNIRQGGIAQPAVPTQGISEIALKAVKCTGAAYAGVDIIQGKDGEFYVLEVNTMPAWMALQRVTRVKVAEKLVEAFLEMAFSREILTQAER